MTDDYQCNLEAIDEQRNIARSYRIEAIRDLFGHTVVTLHWSRIGCQGRGRTVSFPSSEAARAFVSQVLARRATAPRRIGATYRPVA